MMIPVSVITLKRLPEKQAAFDQSNPWLQKKRKFFYAVDGSQDSIPLTQLKRGEMGCFLSHLKLYEHLLKSNDEFLLILEDDAIVSKRLESVITKITKQMVDLDMNMVLLRWTYPNFGKNTKQNPDEDGTIDFGRVYSFFGLDAYIITKKGATSLLKNLNFHLNVPIDVQITNLSAQGTFPVYGIVGARLSRLGMSGPSTTSEKLEGSVHVEENNWESPEDIYCPSYLLRV
jgi:GR25 family glycosyltransferase involved in LPS biosynthesis